MLPPLTPALMAATPPLGSTSCQSFSFSPDGASIACLWADDGTSHRSLWLYTRAAKTFTKLVDASLGLTSWDKMSHSEEMAREISRDAGLGLNTFAWAPHGNRLLIKTSNRLLLCDVPSGALQTYTHPDYITFAAFSPCGQKIVFQSERDLYLLPLIDGVVADAAQALTLSPSPRLIHGAADKVTREEVFDSRAFWFLHKGQSLLFATYHLDGVPEVTLQSGHQDHSETIFYPRPGEAVPCFSLHLMDLATRTVREVLAADPTQPYLEGISLNRHGQPVVARLNRVQNTLTYLALDLENGAHTTAVTLSAAPWINARGGPLFLKEEGSFLLVAECEGPSEILFYKNADAAPLCLSRGAGHVTQILDLSLDETEIYFIANNNTPSERHLFVAPIDGSTPPRQISSGAGVHSALFAPDQQSWIRTTSSLSAPPQPRLESLSGEVEWEIPTHRTPSYLALSAFAPEMVTVTAADGTTTLYGALYKPHTPPTANAACPLIVMPYGGPSAPQRVLNDWSLTADLRAQAFAQAGCYVLKIDNRGTSGRGISFEKASHGQLGSVEVADQAASAKEIAARIPAINPEAIGITGGSYGGYMTLLCCLRHPEVFKAGVALMPVTDWRDYDAQYTERYMGAPAANPYGLRVNTEGYDAASVLTDIAKLNSAVLVIHGMRDENVHFCHTTRLVEAASRAGVPIDFLPMPHDRHSFRNVESWTYLCHRTFSTLLERLTTP